MFRLVKWYFDLVTDDGTAVIAYAARLRLAGIRLTCGATLVSPPAGPAREQSVVRGVRPPGRQRDSIVWQCESLDIAGRWQTGGRPIRRQLACTADGVIRWECVAPRSRAVVTAAGTVLDGWGYVERLRLTIPPWKLPFDHLRWGRFVSPADAVTWIAWDGETPRTHVWLEGELLPGALVSPGVISQPGRMQLVPGSPRLLRDREVRSALAGAHGIFARILPRSLRRVREHKWLARARLIYNDGAEVEGWVIDEEVTWRGRL